MTANLVVRPDALDYLAGRSLDPATIPPENAWRPVPAHLRKLECVAGVGFGDAEPLQAPSALPTEPLLAGLAGEQIPFTFQASGSPDGARFFIGTWGDGADVRDRRHEVVTALLDGVYPSVDRFETVREVALATFPLGALVYGVPATGLAGVETPWDRLLRTLRGTRFAVVVLAEPVEPADLAGLRDTALEDLRVALAAQNARTDLPLTSAYGDKVEAVVASLDQALATGGWRTAIYLLGDSSSFWRLTAAWRGVFSDADASITPLRVIRSMHAARLAEAWGMPDQPAPPGPRLWRHPYLNQTLLNTGQLASFTHFPRLDTPGFSVRPTSTFAVSRREPREQSRVLEVGGVLDQERPTGTSYLLELDHLTRHAFVSGLTGSGKTNTVMHLLTEAAAADIPFLVIEPAKTEYRELLGRRGVGEKLRVFTLGREQVAPLRINPFEVPDGIDVSTHLDLLKAVFMASFAMWIPLPQVLDQCLVQLYTERGWDFTTGDHRGGRSTVAPEVPTLGELVESVERTVPTLGYKPESTQEITASLTTRLNALRHGARGLMLDVERSIPISELLSAPTVIELEGLGDDADKAFVMGLLLVRLYEHRRAAYAEELSAAAAANLPAPASDTLTHLVVVEEAHRLLAQSHKITDAFHADPQGAFADAFSHMLSEVRAYGQGMVIADQVPVRLAPDVLKNTNLKIAHRLVAGDDRRAMAEAMSMSDDQSKVLSTMPPGRAAVFSEGDYTPVIVAVRKAKNLTEATAIDDAAVARAMREWRSDPAVAAYFDDNGYCSGVCRTVSECRAARHEAEDPTGRLLGHQLFNTSTAHPDGIDVVWPDIVTYVASRTSHSDDVASSLRAFAMHAMYNAVSRRATQGDWPRASVDALMTTVRDVVAERTAGDSRWLGTTPARTSLVEAAVALMRRSHDPYPLCRSICPDGTCRFRDTVRDLLAHPRHQRVDANLIGRADAAEHAMGAAKYLAADVIATSHDAPSGRETLDRARWGAIGCAAQVKFCATHQPRRAASEVASALSGEGWNVTADHD